MGYDDHIAAAQAAQASGSATAALEAYRGAIAADPARKLPWLETARLEAEQRRPVDALVAIQEVLRRDPADLDASMLYLDVVLQLAGEGIARLRTLAPEHRAAYLERSQALVEEAIELFGDRMVPAELRSRYGTEAVERYRRNLPPVTPPDGKKISDPLDVLGGG
ncbi:hypothetical protein LY625_00975 [Lysobacter sp. GX 14042]|uniref:hypothetical protein n=1 Tax=Lysobacter sp. GX 14042 TaxID=2907155 RepID=UPI001F3BE04B|nr:hypothetical protein [Lysobacter sp. GX 14042]MCE7031211.1 hypothetical protein [Lysobacter sp. GX 14042]